MAEQIKKNPQTSRLAGQQVKPVRSERLKPLQFGVIYHIYNRGVNGETIFKEKRNYEYFINLYVKHIQPVADTYAFCLLPNHFHLLGEMKALTGFKMQDYRSRRIDFHDKITDGPTLKICQVWQKGDARMRDRVHGPPDRCVGV